MVLPLLLGGLTTARVARDVSEAEGAVELAARGDDVRVLDVRTPREYVAGHLEGAELVEVTSPDFRARVDELPRDASYRLYCRSGNRSGKAARVMAEMGFADVANIGGFDRLVAAGAPVATE